MAHIYGTCINSLPTSVSADNLYKQFGPRSSLTNVWPDLGPTCLTLMIILQEIFEKVDFEKNSRWQKA